MRNSDVCKYATLVDKTSNKQKKETNTKLEDEKKSLHGKKEDL